MSYFYYNKPQKDVPQHTHSFLPSYLLVCLSVHTRILLPCWCKPSVPEDLLIPISVSPGRAEGSCGAIKIYVFIKPGQGEWGSRTQKNEDPTEQGLGSWDGRESWDPSRSSGVGLRLTAKTVTMSLVWWSPRAKGLGLWEARRQGRSVVRCKAGLI